MRTAAESRPFKEAKCIGTLRRQKCEKVQVQSQRYVELKLFAAFEGGSRCDVLAGKSEVVRLVLLYCSASDCALMLLSVQVKHGKVRYARRYELHSSSHDSTV